MPAPPFIVLVDDDLEDLSITQNRLEQAGVTCPVLSFWNSRHALWYFQRVAADNLQTGEAPTLVLCDVEMPDVDGWEILRWIRHEPRLKEMAVVMLSTSDYEAAAAQAGALGADGFLAKHPDPTELDRILQLFLHGSRQDGA